VFVFDPLALTLVLAANASRQWDKINADIIPVQPNKVELPKTVDKKMKDFDITQHPYLFTPSKGFNKNEPLIPNPPIEIDAIIEKPVETLAEVADTVVPDTSQNSPKIKGYTELPGGYVNYQGKHMSLAALQKMHPELFLVPDVSKKETRTEFILGFPKNPQINDIHIRTDMVPNRVFKFDGGKWYEIDKDQISYSEKYIQNLIKKIELGEYDVQFLSDREKREIENYLKNNKT
jgi:hypothetical protein